MNFRIIKRKVLEDFWTIHNDCQSSLTAWFHEAKNAKWQNSNDIKIEYPSASILENNRVVFNIKGNKNRLIIAIHYSSKIIFIRFIGTHAEYDKIDALTI